MMDDVAPPADLAAPLPLDAFEVVGRRFALGTTLDATLDALGAEPPASPRHLTVGGGVIGPFTAARSMVYGPALSRPVLHVTHVLLPFEGDLLDAARAWLGDTQVVATGHEGRVWSVSHHAAWELSPLRVRLSRYGAPRDHAGEITVGQLSIEVDPAAVSAPYLAGFRRSDAAWHADPGGAGRIDVLAVGVRPLFEMDAPPPQDVDDWIAVMRPCLRATPGWVSAALGENEVALWTHPCGAWGIARREATLLAGDGEVMQLEHWRIARARGPGSASLGPTDGHTFVSTRPGDDALDGLAKAAQACGAEVRVRHGLDE